MDEADKRDNKFNLSIQTKTVSEKFKVMPKISCFH